MLYVTAGEKGVGVAVKWSKEPPNRLYYQQVQIIMDSFIDGIWGHEDNPFMVADWLTG